MALSSFVQTRSLELVLAPVASHVSQLVTLMESRGRTSCPDLMNAAVSVMDAVQNMATAAQEVVYGSEDKQLQSDMPVVVEIALKAAEQILEAAGRLIEHPRSKDVQSMLVKGSHGVLEGTMKVLLVWDGAEVKKIVQTALWVLDRLELVQGSKSMRSLVICFGGFSEAMMPLLRMTDKRQMELTNAQRKKQLLAALDHVKRYLPDFTAAMQTYIKSPSAASKESKDSFAREISSGVHNLIKSVKIFDDDDDDEENGEGTENMARNIIHVQRKLATTERFFVGSELDKHLQEIYKNSRAVAHVSRDVYKTKILDLCDEIILLREKLEEQQGMVHTNPESMRAKVAFDQTAETMCDKLLELDRWVADSVVDLVTNTFGETSGPINHLVQAATETGAHTTTATPRVKQTATTVTSSPLNQSLISSASPPVGGASQLEESLKGLDNEVKLFRRHSRRMSQVAAYAAQSSADSRRVSLIKDLADEVDNMTSEVVSAALDVRKSPGNKEMREKLDSMRATWASKVQELTGAIDDVIDPEDFVTISEANIQQDMARCRDAIQNGRWSELVGIVQGIAAKAHRIVEVGKATTETASDESYKTALSRAVQRLEEAIPKMLTLAKKVASNPSSQHTINDFIVSLRELLASIHDIQEELSRGIDVPEQDEEEVDLGMEDEEPDLSTTTYSMTAQERMMRKNLERLRSQPRYIGGLGKRVQSTPRTMESESQQSSPHKHGREDSILSYSEGFSQSFGSGDAETQTPRHKTKDQFSQVEDHYLSTNATLGSPLPQLETLSPFSLSTASWTTPTPSSPLHMDTPSSSFVQASPARVLPSTPTEKAMKSYVSPLQHLVTAARKGDTSEIPGHSSALSARAIRITEFARSAADTVKDDSELVKVLKVKSSEVNLLTPQMIEQAEEVARDPQQRQKLDDLEATSHKWAGHVKQLIDATQQANLPWSKTAENLQKAAMTDVGLQSQIDHVSTQTNRMVDIATMTMKAAETEEAIGFVDNSDSGDAELQEQVQRVKVTASDIQKLTPKLLGAAERAVGNGESSAAMERLNLLSEEWATKAKVLMKRVDDVSLGMGGAADTLFISARSGDHGLLTEQTKSIQTLAESLQDIAQDSVERCTDAEKVKVVQVAAGNIVKLSTRLIECANTVAKDCKSDTGEPSQSNVENVELLRRDWAAQVHHLTAHIDDITAEMSSPLDHLVEVALQANQRSGLAKQHLMDQFESKASFLSDQLEAVCEMFSEVTDQVTVRDPTIEKVNAGLAFLKKLSPHAIGAARSLASEPGSAMLEHFNHLRRQWASKAQVVLASLQKITSTDVDRVIDAFDDLLHLSKRISVATSPVQKSYSNEDVSLLGERLTRANLSIAEPSTPKTVKPSPTLATDNEVVLRQHTVSPHHSERHTSMTVPLPSWNGIESALDASSRSIAFAAQSLKDITDDFVEENNPIVDLAKKMAQQMSQMADYARGQGELQDKDDMIHTAKAIAANGQAIVRFANIISELCTDKKTKASLQSCAEMIPTLSTQLRIIASVKASTPDDTSADVMLVKNAQNLMRAVIRTVHAAEAACMKGLNAPEGDDEAASLATNWRRKLYHQRTIETIRAPRGEKGLRKLNKDRISTPSVVDSIKPAASAMVSPTRHSSTGKYM